MSDRVEKGYIRTGPYQVHLDIQGRLILPNSKQGEFLIYSDGEWPIKIVRIEMHPPRHFRYSFITTADGQGRVVIPSRLRDELKIKTGQTVEVYERRAEDNTSMVYGYELHRELYPISLMERLRRIIPYGKLRARSRVITNR